MSAFRVIHIADVHFRGLSRHNEYRQVFEAFFEKARKLKPDTICIGGDIFHTKTQNISPEVIELLSWWFTSLAEISHVVVTLGNHDGNLMNRNRQDVISPIIAALDNPRISLYKNSGVYPSHVPGFNWCVFSCFDESGWCDVKPADNEINIALFHGSVHGSTTDQDHELKGEVPIEFFDGYDFAMLGDIHKMQFLNYRDCIDGERRPWIAYCGSTIQQNYGENPEHGFLLWDIKAADDFTVDFIPLPNPSRFVTLDWEGDVESLLEAAKEYSDGARFRIRSQGTIGQADWRRLSKELKRKKRAREVVPKVDTVDDGSVTVNSRVILELAHDIRDPKVFSQLLRDYYDNLPEDMCKRLDELITSYIKAAGTADQLARNVRWSLEKLDFSNTFAYGEDNSIDFSNMSGITGIFAGNAMGKSSIIGTIMYALFNATDRGPMKNLHVVNIRKNECQARAEVSINGVKHEITRTSRKITNNRGIEHAVTDLDFKHHKSGQCLNGEQRTVTEKLIRSKIGTAEDFMLTSLAVQGGLKSYINEGASQRKAILSRFLDLQVFEWIHERAKQDSAELKGRIKDMPERDWEGNKALLQQKIGECRADVGDLERSLRQLRSNLAEKQLKLAGFGNTKYVSQGDVDKQKEAVQELEVRHKGLVEEIRCAIKKVEAAQHRVEIVERVKAKFPYKQHLEKEEQKKELDEWIFALEQKLDSEKARIERKERSVLKLVDVPCGDSFPTCKYIKDSHSDSEELPSIRQLVSDLRDDLSGKRTILSSLLQDGSLERLQRYRRIVEKESTYRLQVAETEHKLTHVEQGFQDASAALERERSTLQELRTQVGTGSASLEQIRLKEDIDDIEESIVSMDDERIDIAQSIGRLTESLESLERDRIEYECLAVEWRVYEHLIQATSKKGIPSQILRHLIPAINDEIMCILNGIVDFTIELELPDDSNTMDVYINYGDSRRIIELGSGMEKMVASIAIRVALINVSSLPKTDMLIIDEGFSELDETNIAACGMLLRSLTRWFKNIIIITHIDTLKDVVDNVIDITREGKDAKVMA